MSDPKKSVFTMNPLETLADLIDGDIFDGANPARETKGSGEQPPKPTVATNQPIESSDDEYEFVTFRKAKPGKKQRAFTPTANPKKTKTTKSDDSDDSDDESSGGNDE